MEEEIDSPKGGGISSPASPSGGYTPTADGARTYMEKEEKKKKRGLFARERRSSKVRTHWPTLAYTHAYTCLHICVHTCVHMRTHVYTCVHVVDMRTHACTPSFMGLFELFVAFFTPASSRSILTAPLLDDTGSDACGAYHGRRQRRRRGHRRQAHRRDGGREECSGPAGAAAHRQRRQHAGGRERGRHDHVYGQGAEHATPHHTALHCWTPHRTTPCH